MTNGNGSINQPFDHTGLQVDRDDLRPTGGSSSLEIAARQYLHGALPLTEFERIADTTGPTTDEHAALLVKHKGYIARFAR